jgi:hypothetical protein
MILARQEDRLLVTTQPDHAALAADILALWRTDGLPSHGERQEILFAARQHDNGWREPDAAPRVDPHLRRPYAFNTLPSPLKWEIWPRGVERFVDSHPYASRLIAEHAAQVHRDHRDDPSWSGFFSWVDERRRALDEEWDLAAAQVKADYRFIELTDLLSLALCAGWGEPFERSGLRFRVAGDLLTLSPFPLAGTTTFTLRYRSIPDRDYHGDADLGVELASARWLSRPIRLQGES